MNDKPTGTSTELGDREAAYWLALCCGVFNSIAAVLLVLVIIRHSFFVSEHSGGLEEVLMYLMFCTPVFVIGLVASFKSQFARRTCILLNLSYLVGLLGTAVIDSIDDAFREPQEDINVIMERLSKEKQQQWERQQQWQTNQKSDP